MFTSTPKIIFSLACFLLSASFSTAQSTFIPLNSDYHHLVERYEIKAGQSLEGWASQLKPFPREVIAKHADSLWAGIPGLSAADRFNLDYFQNDNWEWSAENQGDSKRPIFKHLYKKKASMYHVDTKDLRLQVSPVLAGFVGREQNNDNTLYMNTRGLEVRGILANKVGFYSFVTDNQADFPNYVLGQIDALDAVPNEGFYKQNNLGGVDFLTARGYITFDLLKDISNVQFGYDKNFVGNGYRSLILSDFSSNYLFLKLNTHVWKLNYQNIFAQLVADNPLRDGLYPVKYFAMHHLSIDITKNLNIGLFENIVFNRGDTLSNQNGNFDLRYLNPTIFYRAIEQQAGSPDNVNLGLDFRWNFLQKFSLYGQFLIDELIISEVRRGDGWRGNKHALQLGLKYIDVAGINNLDMQVEMNLARPYTYSHNFLYADYSNYNQALAHPLGANFYEYIGILRYQPLPRLQLMGKAIYAKYGTDANGSNWGQNIFLNNSDFEQEYGNEIGQGIETTLLFVDFAASWQLFHNVFIDLKQVYRKLDSAIEARNSRTVFTSLHFRWNLSQRLYEF